jgi:hypothetical protein
MAKSNISVCTPWYLPFLDENHKMCDPWEAQIFLSFFHSINLEIECRDCLPDCKLVLYKQKIKIEPHRNCNENNFGVSNLCLYDSISRNNNYWREQVLNDFDANMTDEKNPNITKSTYLGLTHRIN